MPLAMVFLQFGWGQFTGTEDLYIEDCMKLHNESKRVKPRYLYIHKKFSVFKFFEKVNSNIDMF